MLRNKFFKIPQENLIKFKTDLSEKIKTVVTEISLNDKNKIKERHIAFKRDTQSSEALYFINEDIAVYSALTRPLIPVT